MFKVNRKGFLKCYCDVCRGGVPDDQRPTLRLEVSWSGSQWSGNGNVHRDEALHICSPKCLEAKAQELLSETCRANLK